LARLKAYVGLLQDWNQHHNLVSKNSMADVWRRHVWDSAQLAHYVPAYAKTLADLGSGAGFPGLVLAELLRGRADVILYESIRKKADFLEAAAGAWGSASASATRGLRPKSTPRWMWSRPARWLLSRSCSAMHSKWRENTRSACF
jgi:16S rRNA G527 N7-methylase RsmG